MKFLARISVLIYFLLVLFIGATLLSFSYEIIPFDNVFQAWTIIYSDLYFRVFAEGMLIFLVLVSLVLAKTFLSEVTYDNKLIAFENPAGRVSVSLKALEDLIRRSLSRLDEIKESKVRVRTKRKNILVKINITLRSELNIVDVTSDLQEMVKSKIQDTIGIEGPVIVSVNIGKILTNKVRQKLKRESSKKLYQDEMEHNVPFQGYRV